MRILAPHPSECYVPKNGDIVFECGKWFKTLDKKTLATTKFVHLEAINPITWKSLERLGIEHAEFKKSTEYKCPYTGYDHFGAMPIAVLTDDPQSYKTKDFSSWEDQGFDPEWMRHMWGEKVFEISETTRILMGLGYTDFTRMNDGSRGRIQVRVPLDNGDHLLCSAWEWYNK